MSHRRFNSEILLNKENSSSIPGAVNNPNSVKSSFATNSFKSSDSENVNVQKNTLKNENTSQGYLVKDITNSAVLNNLDQNNINSLSDISANQFNHYTADEFEIEYMPADIAEPEYEPSFPLNDDIEFSAIDSPEFSPIKEDKSDISFGEIPFPENEPVEPIHVEIPQIHSSDSLSNHQQGLAGISLQDAHINRILFRNLNRKYKCRIPRPIAKHPYPRRHRRTLVPSEFLCFN